MKKKPSPLWKMGNSQYNPAPNPGDVVNPVDVGNPGNVSYTMGCGKPGKGGFQRSNYAKVTDRI